jgi:sec-independent protein translocase protein TatA
MRSQLDFFLSECIISKLYITVVKGVCMFGFGMPELIIVLVIVLVVFGAGKLPEIGGALGKSIKNFKRASEGKDEIEIKPGKPDDEKKA